MVKNIEIRNSTAEFLIFMLEGKDDGIQVIYKNETIWATQKAMAQLFDVGVPAISKHLKNIFESGELDEHSVISKMETTASDGKNYDTTFYNLDAIISVGYRVNSVRATQFRQWCTFVLRQFGNVRAVQHDAARICGINARNKVEHRGFACAVSADDCDKITVVQCEAEILNRPFFIDGAWIEHLMDVFQFQHTAHSFPAGTGVNLDFRNFFCNAGTLSASATVTALNSLRSSVERPSCSTKAITI